MDLPATGPTGFADVVITRDDSAPSQRLAAQIWARATAERDGLLVPAAAEEKLPGIQHRLSTGNGSLHIARLRGRAAGFALVVAHEVMAHEVVAPEAVPRETVLELVYLAVAPGEWGAGIGRSLLAHVDDLARMTGAGRLELWVLEDNERAAGVYRRSGWKPTRDLKISAGRRERRLVKELSRRLA